MCRHTGLREAVVPSIPDMWANVQFFASQCKNIKYPFIKKSKLT